MLLGSGVSASAIIDAALQMQLGNPSGATADTNNYTHYLIQRPVEAMDYNATLGQANWASWDFTSADTNNAVDRSTTYFTDTNLPSNFYWVTYNDYKNTGWARGHLCPSADRLDSREHNDMVFLMSNMMPQATNQNSGVWAQLEDDCRGIAGATNELLITCGPSQFTGVTFASGHVAVPAYTWKIIVVVPTNSTPAVDRITYSTRVIAVTIPNSNSVASMKWTNFVTSVYALQAETGLNFFTALPHTLAAVLRSKVDGQAPPAPVISDFSPTTGATGALVTVTGLNLGFVTNLTFNGANAAFTVNSPTNLTATVPVGATSGQIHVAAFGGGTASSPSSFIVGTNTVPDLTVAVAHAGNFTQEDIWDTYTITVTNIGNGVSSGTVTVVDTLPDGLSAAAMSGDGWATDFGTLTCTRSDALPPGSGYPPITLTVNVASNAPPSVTNTATVSGGGDSNLANNVAYDVTSITQITPITLVGWDMSGLGGGLNNYGPSPMAPTSSASNLTVVAGLTRGAGVGQSGTAAARGWGGTTFTNATPESAISSNRFATFTLRANPGYKVSFSAISRFDYQRSDTGPTNGLLQCQVGTNAFTDVTTVSYSVANNPVSLGPINLSGVSALQDIGAGTNVTFRIVNWGGTYYAGTWYVFDKANSAALDLEVQGTIRSATVPAADLALSLTHDGSFTQGDAGRTYTVVVTNSGTAATTGGIAVTNLLPAGLTATAIDGYGWDANLANLTCTRSDVLPVGAAYPPITLTVSVATNAPATVTNTAIVSGGGEGDATNNTAIDPTTIVALAPVQLWRLYWYGTTANSGPAADAFIAPGGIPNLLAYALGLNPLVPTNNPVVGDIATGHLRLTVPRNPDATDISYYVEVTGNLTAPAWTTNGTTVDINTPVLLQAHEDAPVASSAAGFIRLRVTNP